MKIQHKSLNYTGSKFGAGVYQNIINEIPPHGVYVELFGGSGAIIKIKKPAIHQNTICEISRSVIDKSNYPTGVTTICTCGMVYFKSINHLPAMINTFVYADPPYEIKARRAGRLYYANEWTDEQHYDLSQLLKSTLAMVAVSCYRSELYDELYSGWRFKEFNSMTRRGVRKECVYFNYPVPEQLHEYTFLGKNKTDRQRIARKIIAFQQKIFSLPPLEREALLSSLQSGYKNNL